MKNGTFIGIDFGTTNTAVYQLNKNEYGENYLKLADEGDFPFSSMLAEDDNGNVIFGREAEKEKDVYEEKGKLISSFKSKLDSDEKVDFQGNKVSYTEITRYFFESVKNKIKENYKIDVKEAVLSFPVDFSATARKRLIKAAEAAHIEVKDIVSESTAVYLAMMEDVKGASKVMVIDWGGGTIDISILEADGTKVREIMVGGKKVGGDDIDKMLAEYVHNKINNKYSSEINCRFNEMPAEQKAKMRSKCEEAKIALSDYEEDTIPITIRNYGKYETKIIHLSNSDMEDVIKPIIKKEILKFINDVMEKAELTAKNIDKVIIAGGSSNLRPFETVIKNLFGEEKIIYKKDELQYLSARGAAIMQSIDGAYKLNDDIGIELSDGSIFPLLHKDEDGVGGKPKHHTFSLTDDSTEAHFIFKNGNGQVVYAKEKIQTKGFFNEKIKVTTEIGKEQIAKIHIYSPYVSKEYKNKDIRLNKLMFYYNLSDTDEQKEL